MKVYIVVYDGDILEVFDSKKLASDYISDWDNRSLWIDLEWDLDLVYWVEKEVRIEY